MRDVITQLVDVPFARMFILAGIVFLLVAVLGKIEGKIDPGQMGRIGASVLGVVLLVVGVALQFSERDDSIERLAQEVHIQGQNAASRPPAGAAMKASGVARAPDQVLLRIVAGTYGRACNGKQGNATLPLTKACDGKAACDYAVEPVDLGAGQENCAKDFVAEWKCGTGNTVYSATLPANAAKGEKLHLACAG
ncbi:MAG TPA: hypothetical protein VKC56_10700 [Gallionellaceae bacterium]|nr:hypothetical protein [Gallionellaceae bacterium]